LTLRKLHLLLAEWRLAQRFRIEPFYRLMQIQASKELPPIEEIFPDQVDAPAEDEWGAYDNPDDDILFSQAAMVMGAK